MNVYQTNFDGVFVGTTVADPDPMDTGKWLIPAGCVEVAPPEFGTGQFARWTGDAWAVEDVPLPPEPVPEPEPTLDQIAEEARAERGKRLAASDWTQVADAPVNKTSWAAYRQELRDVPQQAGFPSEISWPAQP